MPAARSRRGGSLRSRLVVVVLAIDALATLLTGSAIVWKAQSATSVEIASSMQLAELIVTDTIKLMNEAPPPLILQTIDLQFRSVRHVRIAVSDADGQRVHPAGPGAAAPARHPEAPDWFARLVRPHIEMRAIPVLVRNRLIGNVTIASEPSDEVDEAWTYAEAMLETTAGLNLVVLALLFLSFGRVLAPLRRITTGLTQLEGRDYAVRLPRASVREFATIADHFNRLADSLAAATRSNLDLAKRLVTAQDDERRRTALELHDEAGPLLFALGASASSILAETAVLPDGGPAHAKTRELVALVKRVQAVNRRVLESLRPMGLGRLPLEESLVRILVDLGGEAFPPIESEIGALEPSYGPLVDLTVYRCVQEGLLNAVRHAGASRITLDVAERRERGDGRCVAITIGDDGRGMPQQVRSGRGLAGMRERVEALAGRFALDSSERGTTLVIAVPVEPRGEGRA